MTSGVKWNEDYTDPKADVAQYGRHVPEAGIDPIVSYMRKLPREAPPGSKWVYKTGETHLIGVILSRAIHQTLADYLSEKIWRPYGMERDAVWQINSAGVEWSGCCMGVSLRDYARFAQFVLEGGKAQGRQVVDAKYLAGATRKQVATDRPDVPGYGFQWWMPDDEIFNASGIFGQSIYIDRTRELVMVTSGNWPTATDRVKLQPGRVAFFRAIQAAY
jgi:CubicO group peptidase (beta-lactamase class C family)